MCGIVIYKGKSMAINKIFEMAYFNKHRGDDDGFGYYDFTNKKLTKTILEFDEVKNNELAFKRKDDKGALKRRLTILKKEMKQDTSFIVFHHRKASAGRVCTENTHPIKIKKDIHYCQNGTVGGYYLLKKYFEIYKKQKYQTTTDTEIVSKFIENKIKDVGYIGAYNQAKKLFQTLGVIIRINTKKDELIIFKDDDRSLFMYEKNGEFILLSEPMPSKTFDSCYRLDRGVFKFNSKGIEVMGGEMVKVKDRILEFMGRANGNFKCDCCGVDNGRTIRIKNNKDYCLGCITKDEYYNLSKTEGEYVEKDANIVATKWKKKKKWKDNYNWKRDKSMGCTNELYKGERAFKMWSPVSGKYVYTVCRNGIIYELNMNNL